jgi:hypothetical protein
MVACQASGEGLDQCFQIFELVISPSVGIFETHLIQLDRVLIMRPSNDQGVVNLEPKRVSLPVHECVQRQAPFGRSGQTIPPTVES